MAARIILWDVMDTLVRDPFRDAMPGFFGMTLAQMLEAKHPDAWVRFERGELSEPDFLRSFFHDGREYDHAGFKAFIAAAYEFIDGIPPLLAALQARGHAMHVLSNYPEWHTLIETRLQLSRFVAWTFVSCKLGLRKPDPAIYRQAAQALSVGPSDCLFIDDRARNCEAARAVGMDALQFTGDVAALRAELSHRGFL
ncbi:MAG TPA: HAD family phosphatase [Polyangiales bacterium]|nr:HAD family phosphatase [Polyangiales bacterium]